MSIKPKIIIASSEPSDIPSLEKHLSGEGYEISDLSGDEEIFIRASSGDTGLLILDPMIRKLDVFNLIKKLRSNDNTRFTPIILIVPEGDQHIRDEGISAGCDDFITRPLDIQEITTRIYTLLQIAACRPLLNEKERFEYILNNIGQGIIVFDGDLEIEHANQMAYNLLNIDPGNIPSDFLEHLKRNLKINYAGDLKSAMRNGVVSFDIERMETDKTKKMILEARTNIIKNPLGETSGVVMILHDVTEIRKEDLLKQNFLGLISHKLRTPITVINMYASSIEDGILGPVNEQQKEAISGIMEKSRTLLNLVEKLLGFTQIVKEDMEASKEQIDLKKYLSGIIDSKTRLFQDKNVDFNILCPDNILIETNKVYFDLIIENLVENAVKFNDKESAKINITVNRESKTTKILISDNGPGIPAEEKEKVFEKFYQVEKYFTGNVEGAGLGLALSKHIANAYGWDIALKSTLGKGTIFILSFPDS